MFKNIEAVIFDLDGTLIDSMGIWKQVDIEFLGNRGIELPADLQCCIEGKSFTETALYFKERFKLKESIEDIKEEWRIMAEEYYKHKIALKSGAKEFLSVLSSKGIKIAIATSNSKDLVNHILNNHNIQDYFSFIRTSCEVPRGKPHPDVYLKVAEDLNIIPTRCLAFEDTLAGVTAAKSAGMRVVAIADEASYCSKDKIIELAEEYIESFDEIIKKI